jgi:cytoskeletal protein RodZ
MPDQDPQAHSELASFGEELRREREIRSISLKEIADSTKISKRFLEAIERNDHKTLPAPVFTRGFVREYARYLGLSVEEMVNRYNFAAAGDDRIEKTAHLERLVAPPPPLVERPPVKRGIPPAYARVDRSVYVLIAIVIALIAASYWALRYKRSHAEAESRADAVVPAVTMTHVTATTAQPAATAPPVVADTNQLRLGIELTESSVIELEADGKTVFNDVLHEGDSRTFEAKESFKFRTIGNAGGVALRLNDTAIPSIGKKGKVIHDFVLDREYLRQHSTMENKTST